MITWFSENLWALWVLAALIFAVIEMLSLDFFCLMLSVASLLTSIGTFFINGLPLQIVLFAAISLILLLTLRPKLVRRLNRNSPNISTNTEALLGQRVEILQDVTTRQGLIRLAGDTWTARTEAEFQPLPQGTFGTAMRIDGATAYIQPE
ncbi:NfeD family protein [Rothia aerolata]|uniref:Membrane protein n=1 Tax=Rothia aerolata TaxID=1812262 RepID=A0A917IKX9_9MICC|nr:NfeD family protein [Rothia aerolata]GGH57512.1 membrane protein [Rothia aerolata]